MSEIVEDYDIDSFSSKAQTVFKTKVHENNSSAIKIGNNHFTFTKIRVANIEY